MTNLSGSQLPWPVLAAIARLSEREKQDIIKRLEAKQKSGNAGKRYEYYRV